jgi:hypothetical protein
MKRISGCLLLALLRVLLLPAAEQPLAPAELPADEAELFIIGLSTLQGLGLSTGNEYLTSSIPLLLEERIEAMESHDFSAEEQEAYRRGILEAALRQESRKLAELRAARDELLFSSLSRRARREQAASLDVRIGEAEQRIQALRGLAPETVAFAGRKPVQIVTGTRGGRLLEAPLFSPLGLARQEGIDLLVWGLIEEVEDYLYLELHAYHSVLRRELYSYRNAVRLEAINTVIEEATRGLAAVILGRSWAALAVTAEPGETRLYLDGRYIGQGEVDLDYLAPGTVELAGRRPGYRDELLRLELPAGERKEVKLALMPAAGEKILLVSDPPQAAVYEGSEWRGTTPLTISRPEDQQRLLLRREGFLDFSIYLAQDTADALSVSLVPDSAEPASLQSKRRDKFYTAMGLFVLSIPVPYLCYSYAADYATAYEQAGAADQSRLYDANRAFYSAYWAGLAVSASLFVNMMVNLIQYIRSADRNAG